MLAPLERLKVAACGLAGAAWSALSAAGRAFLGPERFDRMVDASGLRRLKSRLWLERIVLADGTVLLHRPQDRCIIEEVAGGAYASAPVEPGATVVDVGAHIGTFALLAARMVGPSGRVVALEPSPATLELLRRNVALNGLSWVKVHPVGAAEAEGTAELFTASGLDNPAADTLSPTPGRRGVMVRLARLDDVLAQEGCTRVDLLKLDVEGAELRALAGAPRTLALTRRIVMEVHPPAAPLQEVRRVLEGAGFDCRVLTQKPGSAILDAARVRSCS
ncbi:MAG: FkbM family methyltransferase [Elusimicrobia bacterium]|nr:FkbM family methyltransferase [Elusimicrobiota bacterium]